MSRTRIEVVEVGTRDGLQTEPVFVPTETKIDIVNALYDCGIRRMEVTSFVSPRAVPQLRDAAEVIAGVRRGPDRKVTALVPNVKGAERAAEAKVDEMVIFLSVSETHNQKNVNRSIQESLDGFRDVVAVAAAHGIGVHAGIAVSFGCPFEGDIPEGNMEHVVGTLASFGVRSISLGDTTGMATPPIVRRTVRAIRAVDKDLHVGLHFHNTRGVGLVCVMAGLEEGITSFDASVAGLGGCPFAPGATGNICTEDLVYMLEEMGYDTGVDLDRLISVARRMERVIGRPLPGQLMKAGHRLKLHAAADARRAVG